MAVEALLHSSWQPKSLRPALDSYVMGLQALEDYRNFSATTIQRYYRGWICRVKRKRQDDAEPQQQTAAKASAQQQLYTAARTIQNAWRRFNCRRIYHYYRDLIRFKEAGDPRQMLRCINTREAALIDPAAGLHVRFRLGGSSFPPLVFYKIYTHRPVTDIGAFGPRNYAAEHDSQLPTAAALHNHKSDPSAGSTCSTSSSSIVHKQQRHTKHDEEFELPAKLREYIKPDGTLGYRSTRGWYRREDGNGWRPVAERLLLDQEHQALLSSTAAQQSCKSSRCRKHRRRRRRRLHVHHAGACNVGLVAAAGSMQEPSTQQQLDCSSSDGGSDGESGDGGSKVSSSGRSSPVYHYSPVVRREERARQLKQRRRQWLLKMYRAGMRASSADDGTGDGSRTSLQDNSSSAGAADGTWQSSTDRAEAERRIVTQEERILQVLESQLLGGRTAGAGRGSTSGAVSIDSSGMAAGNSDADDWSVDDLVELGLDAGILAWSQKLDFDSYQQHWNSTAVTLGSSVLVPESEKLILQRLQQQVPE